MNLATAYPAQAGVNQWIRTIRLNRGEDIVITDAFDLSNTAREITLSLMTPCQVSLDEPGKITLQQTNQEAATSPLSLNVFFEAEKLTAEVEKISISDRRLKSIWGEQIVRILLRTKGPTGGDSWRLRIVP